MNDDFPHDIEIEKQILSGLMLKNGEAVPVASEILTADDFYRPEHRIIYSAIQRLYFSGTPVDPLSIMHELQKTGDLERVDHRYFLGLIELEYSTVRMPHYCRIVKEHARMRQLIFFGKVLSDEARRGERNSTEILVQFDEMIRDFNRSMQPHKFLSLHDYALNEFKGAVAEMKAYVNRLTYFSNIDAKQFFAPGLYVIGATPAAGKTTFCYQLLEQLARQGETCIYCSYEMSRLELFTKTFARELFRRDKHTSLTAADIRRGSWSAQLDALIDEVGKSKTNLQVLELQDETIDDLLAILRPVCSNKAKAPVVCLDYLQIVPTDREVARLGIDDSVRKLKKFQRDTNTTFIVISSFNRTNYAQSVSFESFKESGNIEYTADVVWALQLAIMDKVKGFTDQSELRKKIDMAKKKQPRQIQLKCLKNRQGTNYDCFFNYHSAHDYFEPVDGFSEEHSEPKIKSNTDSKNKKANGRII